MLLGEIRYIDRLLTNRENSRCAAYDCLQMFDIRLKYLHSHSMVLGGLELISRTIGLFSIFVQLMSAYKCLI